MGDALQAMEHNGRIKTVSPDHRFDAQDVVATGGDEGFHPDVQRHQSSLNVA